MTPLDTARVATITGWLEQPASTNLRVLAWVLGMVAVLVVLAFIGRAIGRAWIEHGKDITKWIGTAPTTNLRILVGIVLAIVFVLGTMLSFVLGFAIAGEALLYVGGFILLQMGLDVAHYGVKRATFKPEALGMTRESVSPLPAQPAAAIVAATGEQAVATPAAEMEPSKVTVLLETPAVAAAPARQSVPSAVLNPPAEASD